MYNRFVDVKISFQIIIEFYFYSWKCILEILHSTDEISDEPWERDAIPLKDDTFNADNTSSYEGMLYFCISSEQIAHAIYLSEILVYMLSIKCIICIGR